ncbi:substrate-binding domain-containing protein [Rhodocytophaga aerolata]|uniref:Substrate-binding domain-containing protein n=1 Tax=Rhodocytophaga aerolata TaxID=455078 RepID=A0ABT8R9G5_9BACT|nr:substrate-binding domain-containing protein [Rhodocytophaga aerolata]MDO1448743.1 substrate-binding domain-containing protein [Rhodocytophaga aerolata]
MIDPVHFRIGGVPEHFNLPWHLAIDEGWFEKESIQLIWKDYPGGTGAMAKDLRSGELDIAVLLTEGIVADIAKGNPSKIVSMYVQSPLIWGIHVPATSSFTNIEQMQGKRYAISRMGSGSHLMAYVDARQRGWQLTEEQLVIVGDLNGAREAFKMNTADIFMWERFMTQPFVDKGEFRRLGECPTPWPCFVIAARQEIINQFGHQVEKLLKVIFQASKRFMEDETSPGLVARNFGLSMQDAATWFALTKWAQTSHVPESILLNVANTLLELHLVEKPLESSQVYQRI